MSDSVLGAIRKELKRVSPNVRIEAEQISTVLEHEVIKRKVLESEKYAEAIKAIARAAAKVARNKKEDAPQNVIPISAAPTPQAVADSPAVAIPPTAAN